MKKTTITSIAAALGALTLASAAVAQTQAPVGLDQQVSVGEQTKRDLAAWREAGFTDHAFGALSQDVYGAEYQKRFAKYQELRQSR